MAGIWAPVFSLKWVGRAIMIVVGEDGGGRPKWMEPWLYAAFSEGITQDRTSTQTGGLH